MKTASANAVLTLEGLAADNLLAFLALIGLLRALEAARPTWRPRVFWDGVPPKVALSLSSDSDPADAPTMAEAVSAAAAAGIMKLAPSYRLPKDDLKFGFDEFRGLATAANNDRERARLVAALASDGALRRNGRDREVEPTPLCAMFGQGHQSFLQRLARALASADAGSDDQIQKSLFERWQYRDDVELSFRWDPTEDRRHAYQFGDPREKKYKVGTVRGANQLAATGFAVFTSVPTASGLGTLGVSGRRADRDVVWPLVSVPTSLRGHVALLAHPLLYDPRRCEELSGFGVLAIARARRYSVGKYLNFERARIQYVGGSSGHRAVAHAPGLLALRAQDPQLDNIVRRLVGEFRPERIYLFGSKARGDGGADSDYDLMVVVRKADEPEYRLSQRAHSLLWDLGSAADILVWTAERFERQRHLRASLPATILREGIALYG